MANQLRRGEIGEPVELVAQIAWLVDVLMKSRVGN